MRLSKLYLYIILSLSALCYGYIGYEVVRQDTRSLIFSFGILFLLYGLLIQHRWKDFSWQQWAIIAVGLRLIFIVAIPALSEDYARFVWDGRLVAHALNPFEYLPNELINSQVASFVGLTDALYTQLNSAAYYSVYPPVCQGVFGIAAWLSQNDLKANVVFLRLLLILADIGILFLIPKLTKNQNTVFWYAFNPLVIVELSGNLHFEGLMLVFILGTIYFFKQKKFGLSALYLAFGVGTKLLPLIFLPLLVRKLSVLKAMFYCAMVGGISILLWVPFLNIALIKNVWSSVDLYFQKFEFNASFYYLLRAVGFWLKGYNIIAILGPALSMLTLLGIIWIASKRASIAEKALWSLTLYFLLATTIHPWYITTLIGVGCLTRFVYPIAWSALLPLTYLTYKTIPYEENLWIIAIEYLIVLSIMSYEFLKKPIDYE